MEMLEYIKWRGDLTFDERELNVVDSLIFSMLSYETFDGILYHQNALTLKEVSDIFFTIYKEEDLKNRKTFTNRSYELLKAMAASPRYQSLILSNYVNDIDNDANLQFCALTIEHKNKWKYVVFRGTDDTFIGWKEDFMMTYKDEVLSQKKAVDYLHTIFNQDTLITKVFQTYDYYIGGHSKGGNLAIYASGQVSKHIQKRIKRIDNFDGPGFSKKTWALDSMQSIIPKIHTYIPTASFFGRMFEHHGNLYVVNCKQIGLLQHNLYNWLIDVDKLSYADDVSDASDKAVNGLNELLEDLSNEEREKLIENLFNIFDTLHIYNYNDLTKLEINKIIKALFELNELSEKEKKVIIDLVRIIIDLSSIKMQDLKIGVF